MKRLWTSASLSSERLFDILRDGKQELALLDVREKGRFGEGHIIVASSSPLSRLELDISRLVPRTATPIIFYDDGDGLAERARARLTTLGYCNMSLLEGGLRTWQSAGYAVYDGLNTPSKALGVFMHRELAIPEIQPDELADLIETSDKTTILDCRPFNEYQNGTIPGSINCPGATIVGHGCDTADPSDIVVVHCAGRTRGLAGAQTLIDNGFKACVVALRDGTMGWQLSGREIEKNADRSQSFSGKTFIPEGALAHSERIRALAGIAVLDSATLQHMRADKSRASYVFDIREEGEFEAAHIAGARHAPGGQLVQNLDMHVATRGATLIVTDRDGVRATTIALWLRRMGWRDVSIARIDDGGHPISMTAVMEKPMVAATSGVQSVTADILKGMLEKARTNIVDLASSRDYRKGHLPGAWFIVRSRLAQQLGYLPRSDNLVLTSQDGVLAHFAAKDDIPFDGEIFVLAGGTDSWRAAGYELSFNLDRLIDVADDIVPKPSELPEGPARDEAMRLYLDGSEELLAKVEREGILRFAALPVV